MLLVEGIIKNKVCSTLTLMENINFFNSNA